MNGIIYYLDDNPGYTRKPWGKGFAYFDEKGNHIRDESIRRRIEKLAIPPAWKEVWISPRKDSHVLATGRDSKGRKQYIYHPGWEKLRSRTKFHHLIDFGYALPDIRKVTEEHLHKRGFPREKVLALIIKIMDETGLRVGSQKYAEKNHSYGVSTLRKRHMEEHRGSITFHFKGKSGKYIDVDIDDPELVHYIRESAEIPGYEIFKYFKDGKKHYVESSEVNDYLRSIAGDFTSKTFRTWTGTVKATEFFSKEEDTGRTPQVVKKVAAHLKNTPAVCRQHYIHPKVIETYEKGLIAHHMEHIQKYDNLDLERYEKAVLSVLEE